MKKIAGLFGLIAVWQLAAYCLNSKIFPTPMEVAVSFLNDPHTIAIHCAYSVVRLTAGVLSAVAVGVPIGVLLGYFKKANRVLSPILYIASPIPKIALLPLIMILFGIGSASKIFIIFLVMVFQIIVTIRDGVTKIPDEYFMSCRAAKTGTPFIFRHIIFPSSLPSLFTAVRVGLATGISVLFFAESFGTRWGVGFYVMDMWMRLDYKRMYLGIITFGVMGLLSTALADRLEKIVCPWADYE